MSDAKKREAFEEESAWLDFTEREPHGSKWARKSHKEGFLAALRVRDEEILLSMGGPDRPWKTVREAITATIKDMRRLERENAGLREEIRESRLLRRVKS